MPVCQTNVDNCLQWWYPPWYTKKKKSWIEQNHTNNTTKIFHANYNLNMKISQSMISAIVRLNGARATHCRPHQVFLLKRSASGWKLLDTVGVWTAFTLVKWPNIIIMKKLNINSNSKGNANTWHHIINTLCYISLSQFNLSSCMWLCHVVTNQFELTCVQVRVYRVQCSSDSDFCVSPLKD